MPRIDLMSMWDVTQVVARSTITNNVKVDSLEFDKINEKYSTYTTKLPANENGDRYIMADKDILRAHKKSKKSINNNNNDSSVWRVYLAIIAHLEEDKSRIMFLYEPATMRVRHVVVCVDEEDKLQDRWNVATRVLNLEEEYLPLPDITNIVATSNLFHRVNRDEIVPIQTEEYTVEVYKTKNPDKTKEKYTSCLVHIFLKEPGTDTLTKCSVLIFQSGRLVCSGCNSKDQLRRAQDILRRLDREGHLGDKNDVYYNSDDYFGDNTSRNNNKNNKRKRSKKRKHEKRYGIYIYVPEFEGSDDADLMAVYKKKSHAKKAEELLYSEGQVGIDMGVDYTRTSDDDIGVAYTIKRVRDSIEDLQLNFNNWPECNHCTAMEAGVDEDEFFKQAAESEGVSKRKYARIRRKYLRRICPSTQRK